MVKNSETKEQELISKIKTFYKITDFKSEILDWKFKSDKVIRLLNDSTKIVIGHPQNSHKGSSLGDILPYTCLPEELYRCYGIKCYIPSHFKDVFKYNPYIAGIDDNVQLWGSLGSFGTTVQRTCNVWGIKTKFYSPFLYYDYNHDSKLIITSINSNTGGTLNNYISELSDVFNCLRDLGYYIIQIGTNKDKIIPNLNKYCFNLQFDQLVHLISCGSYYIGIQNSLYHLSKSLDLKVIGILPSNIDPFFVKLPFLTQCNLLETNMLSESDHNRINNWIAFVKNNNKNPNDSHHIGWLYPDSVHLTVRDTNSEFCPKFNIQNIIRALNNQIYPYSNPIFYNYYVNSNYWD